MQTMTNDISGRLRAAIERSQAKTGRKITQAWLADKMGCTRENLNIMLSESTGRKAARSHKADLVLRAAEILGVDPYWLYFGERAMEPVVDASKYDEARMRVAISGVTGYLAKQRMLLGPDELAELITLIYRLNIGPEQAKDTISSILNVTKKNATK